MPYARADRDEMAYARDFIGALEKECGAIRNPTNREKCLATCRAMFINRPRLIQNATLIRTLKAALTERRVEECVKDALDFIASMNNAAKLNELGMTTEQAAQAFKDFGKVLRNEKVKDYKQFRDEVETERTELEKRRAIEEAKKVAAERKAEMERTRKEAARRIRIEKWIGIEGYCIVRVDYFDDRQGERLGPPPGDELKMIAQTISNGHIPRLRPAFGGEDEGFFYGLEDMVFIRKMSDNEVRVAKQMQAPRRRIIMEE